MKKCAICYNQDSGKFVGKNSIEDIVKEFKNYNYEVLLCPTKGYKDAINIVENLPDDIDLVVCAGGDGTLNECVAGNYKRKRKLLLSQLPVGTTNDVASMYGYTKDIKENIKMLVNGLEKNVDICFIDECPFVYVSCIGSYVDASYNTPRSIKKKYGRIGYVINVLHEFRTEEVKKFHVDFEVDDKKISGEYSFIFITNTNRMGGVNNVYKDIKLDDSLFEVALCKANTKKDIFLIASKILNSPLDKIDDIEYYRTNKFKITFDKIPPSWIIDGEEYKHSKKTFDFSIKNDMNMKIPKKNVDNLFIKKEG